MRVNTMWKVAAEEPVVAEGKARKLPANVITSMRSSLASRRHVKVSLAPVSSSTREQEP